MPKEFQKNLIKNLKRFFQKEKGILFCYLFGSLSYQNFISKSDVDLAVYLKDGQDFFERRLKLIGELSRFLKREVDLVILNTAPPFLKYVILREGKLIFEKDRGKRIEFELKAINEYFDYKPILERYYQRLLK